LGDNKKPLNNVTATLQPGNLVYNGDDQNNGYFFFDNITPGSYKLYLTAEDYTVDSASITVSANKSLFINKNLSLVPNNNAPNIIANLPSNNSTGVSNAINIEVTFDIRMDKSSTQGAFSISPSVEGTFSWKDNQKKLIFNPKQNLTAGGTYTVTINNNAKTIFDKNLLTEYSYTFSTRSKLNLLSAYPINSETDISQSVQVILEFDHAISSSTLAGNIKFEDADGKFVSLTVDQAAYAKGFITFVPSKPLKHGASYKVILGENIGDTEGVKFQENIEITFIVETETYIEGNLVDDFETTGNWDSPIGNSGSVGLDASSSFTLSSSKKYGGSYSGKSNYSFTANDAYYKISKVTPVTVGNGETEFGLWILGDLSYNIIEYWFLDSNSNIHSIEVDTLNFTGWKMKSVKLSDVASGNLKFEGFGIKHYASADSTGVVYIDNAQYNFSTPVQNVESDLPTEYSLYQNYPNPFNPSTVIKYSIPVIANGDAYQLQNVSLKIYDILGREVATLINQRQKAGNYEVTFKASNFTSGIYFYKLQSGSFIESKKMIYLK
jgi:hypothetical protein